MELLQLKYFKKVAETGKITTAAEALYISAPALSTTISRLEREMGIQLFDRHGNRIALNPQGEIFLRYVNRILDSLDAAKTEMIQSLQQAGGQVQIAVTSADVWREMLSFFTVAHPEVRLVTTTLTTSQMESVSLTGRYTFLLAGEGEVRENDWASHELFEDRLLLMIHKDNPLADSGITQLRQIAGQRLFLPPREYAFNRRIRSLLEQEGISGENLDECADVVCRTMALDNRGISFFTRYTDPDGERNANCITLEDPKYGWKQLMYWDKNRILQPGEELFRSFAIDFFHNHKFNSEVKL